MNVVTGMPGTSDAPIVSAAHLKVWFPVARKSPMEQQRYVRAVDDVSLRVERGRTLGLVGESGSGKTTVGRALLRLIPATSGSVLFDGVDVLSLRGTALRAARKRMQIIFQDPMGSLNPRMMVESIVTEPLAVHTAMGRRERSVQAARLLERVGLSSMYLRRYPHEFSGGQRQRIGIARALASDPSFIVCDEPVSALDVSIQAQILNLLADLQRDLGIAYLFIAHNLAVVEHIASQVAVMYLGRIVELASRDALYGRPLHPYTRALMSAVPVTDPGAKSRRVHLTGETPSPVNPPPGCHFNPRCPIAKDSCRSNSPELLEREPGHWVRCPYAE